MPEYPREPRRFFPKRFIGNMPSRELEKSSIDLNMNTHLEFHDTLALIERTKALLIDEIQNTRIGQEYFYGTIRTIFLSELRIGLIADAKKTLEYLIHFADHIQDVPGFDKRSIKIELLSLAIRLGANTEILLLYAQLHQSESNHDFFDEVLRDYLDNIEQDSYQTRKIYLEKLIDKLDFIVPDNFERALYYFSIIDRDSALGNLDVCDKLISKVKAQAHREFIKEHSYNAAELYSMIATSILGTIRYAQGLTERRTRLQDAKNQLKFAKAIYKDMPKNVATLAIENNIKAAEEAIEEMQMPIAKRVKELRTAREKDYDVN